jgi:hypothetical protein
VLPEHLITIARINSILDVEELREMPVDLFFEALCKIHNATMTGQWCRLVEEVKMRSTTWSLEAFIEYTEEFRMQMIIAGTSYAPPQKEIVKLFINGLSPKTLQFEIRKKNIESLDEAMDTASQVVVQYKAIFDLQAFKESDKKNHNNFKSQKKDSSKKDSSSGEAGNSKKGSAENSPAEEKFVPTCYKCLQKGHTVRECTNPKDPKSTWKDKSDWKNKRSRAIKASSAESDSDSEAVSRSVRVFSTDIDIAVDEFIRLKSLVMAVQEETKVDSMQVEVALFMDSGANINSITRAYSSELQQLLPGLEIMSGKPLKLELAGKQFVTVSGDYIELILQFDTKSGPVRSREKFLIFEECGEQISLGVSSVKHLLGNPGMATVIFGAKDGEMVSIEEKEFSDEVQLYPDQVNHSIADIHVDETFPDLDTLSSIINRYAPVLFGPFDAQGLKVEPVVYCNLKYTSKQPIESQLDKVPI